MWGKPIKERDEEMEAYIKNIGIEYRYSCYSEKDPVGCNLLGEYLRQMKNDHANANKVFKMNCDEKSFGRSCASYARNLLFGVGCERNYNESIKYFKRACELNDAMGCDYAGKLLSGVPPEISQHIELDPANGIKHLEKGCNLNDESHTYESGESCYAAAVIYNRGSKHVTKNDDKVIEYAGKACEYGQVEGCQLASDMLQMVGKYEQAAKYEMLYERLRKQMTDNTELELQRT